MRYSIAALSLVSPALALPTFGDLFGGHHLLGGLFWHDHSHGSSYADAPTYNGGPASYDEGSSPANGGPAAYGDGSSPPNGGYSSGPVPYGQGSSYGDSAPQANGTPSSVVDAASTATSVPKDTGTRLSAYGTASATTALAYSATYSASSAYE